MVTAIARRLEHQLAAEADPDLAAYDGEDPMVGCPVGQQSASKQHQKRFHKTAGAVRGMLQDSVEQKILKYFYGAREAFAGSRDVHVSIDASRIGRRNCLITSFGQRDGTFAWGPPQAVRAIAPWGPNATVGDQRCE